MIKLTVDSVLRAARAKLLAVLRAAWMAPVLLSVAEGTAGEGVLLLATGGVVTSIWKIKQNS